MQGRDIGANDPKAFLGSGVAFPIRVDENTGRMEMASYEEGIQESIRVILMTRQGERLRNPRFGCGIHSYIFDTMDFATLAAMKREVEKALTLWEPRIDHIEVEAEVAPKEEGLVLIRVSYVVRSTNNPFNLVFPYFIDEGFGGMRVGTDG